MAVRAAAAIALSALALTPRTVSAASGADRAGEVASRLQEKYSAMKTLSASFTQEAASTGLSEKRVSRGEVYFKKPGKMRWRYTHPVKDEIASDGRTVWVYQPDLNQVMERPADSGMTADFLTGVGNLTRDFNVTLESETGSAVLLGLTPKARQPGLKRLTIEVDKELYLVRRTVVTDHYGNVTEVVFTDIRVNEPLKDTLFEFSAPEGSTIVRP
jgi:outer membrane lipoprotein carrier protein